MTETQILLTAAITTFAVFTLYQIIKRVQGRHLRRRPLSSQPVGLIALLIMLFLILCYVIICLKSPPGAS